MIVAVLWGNQVRKFVELVGLNHMNGFVNDISTNWTWTCPSSWGHLWKIHAQPESSQSLNLLDKLHTQPIFCFARIWHFWRQGQLKQHDRCFVRSSQQTAHLILVLLTKWLPCTNIRSRRYLSIINQFKGANSPKNEKYQGCFRP